MDIISKVDVGLNDIPKSESLIVDTKNHESEENEIKQLEEKLKLLEDENCDLAEQKYDHQRQILLGRYMNGDFTLSQMQYIFPVKRTRIGRSLSNNLDLVLSTNFLSLKHFLNPATNLVYRKMHELVKETQTKVRQSNDDLLAWKFTPENSIGKRLMSGMRHLLSANEELGKVNEADRIRTLESELELQKSCMKEFIKTNEEIEKVLEEAYTDLEGLQTSLLGLNQQISQAESIVQILQNEIECIKPGRVTELMTELLVKISSDNSETQCAQSDSESRNDEELQIKRRKIEDQFDEEESPTGIENLDGKNND